ncbi:MAG TPA: hypothetical protein EYH26_00530 [Pyrodictium sp.]|nr:hypothetical protein [Pyrodictium sp.]
MKVLQLLKPLGAALILVLLIATGFSPSIWMLWEHIRYMQFEKEAQANLKTNIGAERVLNETSSQKTQYTTTVTQGKTPTITTIPVYQETQVKKAEHPLLSASTTFTISINAPSLVTASTVLLLVSGTLLDKLLEAYVSLTYKGIVINTQNPVVFTVLGIGILAFFAA